MLTWQEVNAILKKILCQGLVRLGIWIKDPKVLAPIHWIVPVMQNKFYKMQITLNYSNYKELRSLLNKARQKNPN